jgi:hypothetical protein
MAGRPRDYLRQIEGEVENPQKEGFPHAGCKVWRHRRNILSIDFRERQGCEVSRLRHCYDQETQFNGGHGAGNSTFGCEYPSALPYK